ncbi:hypothetical protein LTS17_001742 [Exophiala oligosperma]
MTYESQVSFTLDTICPWTALRRFGQSEDAKSTTFVVKYFPYQLSPDAPKEDMNKREWYGKTRYGDSEEKMKMYTTLMTAYGDSAGIKFKFGGTISNTLEAHRVIQYFQEKKGLETADKIINSLYYQFFEDEKSPASDETLLKATADAGIPGDEARAVIEDKSEGLMDVKALIREQASNGIDSIPNVLFEGKKRDFTLVGAKDVEEYEKVLHQIAKESN